MLASDEQSVAILGTRNPTTYSLELVGFLSRGLVEAGLTVVSGLALGSVVVEAAEGSAAWYTGYHALEQDREVFCVRERIFSPASDFANRMIKEGVKLVMGIADTLEELNLEVMAERAKKPRLSIKYK